MNSKSKLATIAIVAAVAATTQTLAFAQPLQTATAATREQLHGYGFSPSQFVPYYGRQTDRANGRGVYAEVPRVIRHAPRPYRTARLHRRSRHGLRAFDMVRERLSVPRALW